ncbi:unnamed protein product [Adineta steineri]|uniref:Uncharacterized protein n=1 Tax=Adineta steineri TaxID=433720 RepID=A0A818IFS4_9BILA|nr:unnamed protein product [Adineta steineri]
MQHELGTENMVMFNNPDNPTTRSLALVKDLKVQRPRIVLLSVLGICLGTFVIGTLAEIANYEGNLQKNTGVVISIVFIAFYGFGLLVSYRYSETGLRVFAWWSIIMVGLIGIGLAWLIPDTLSLLFYLELYSPALKQTSKYLHITQMQHKRGPENMVIMNDHYTLTTKPLAQVNDPQVQRSRRVLLIMLGICLGFCLISAFVRIVNYTRNSQANTELVDVIALIVLIASIASVAFYGYGLFVSYRYSDKGLRVVCNLI